MKPGAQTVSRPVAGGGRRQPSLSLWPSVLFWWPALLLGAFTGSLWLMGPRGHLSMVVRASKMPEPGAAYVWLSEDAQSVYLKQDIFTNPSGGFGLGRARGWLDARAFSTIGVKKPPYLLPAPLPESASPAPLAPRFSLPPLFGKPADTLTPMIMATPLTNGVRTVLSPGLRLAAFAFDLSRADLPSAPGAIRCHIELDDAGRVIHLLVEKDETPIDVGVIQATVGRGRGTGVARGVVDIVWNR